MKAKESMLETMRKQHLEKEAKVLKDRYNIIFAEKLKGTGHEMECQSPVYKIKSQEAFVQLKKETGRPDLTWHDLQPESPWISTPIKKEK